MAFNFAGSSGNMILVQSQTASNVANLVFTSGISGFDVYYLLYYGVTVATNGQILNLQLSTNGGSTYNATTYSMQDYFAQNNTLAQGSVGARSGFTLADTMDNSSSFPCSGYAYMYNFGNASFQKQCIATYSHSYVGNLLLCQSGTVWTTTTVVNAFKIIPAAGNILTGTFKLYGIQL